MNIDAFVSRLEGVKRCGGYYIAKCPAHADHKQSLSVSVGDDGRILVKCHTGCTTESIVSAMGMKMTDLFADKELPKTRGAVVARYEYRSDDGQLIAIKQRYDNKDMMWRHPDGRGGWKNGTGGAELPLYKHECITDPVYLVEGEKDVDTLMSGGLSAVTNPNGANEWKDRYTQQLSGFNVAVIPDNDEAGLRHALKACNALKGVAASVKLLKLPELWDGVPDKGDISDYVQWCRAAGHKDANIFKSIEVFREATPEYTEQAVPEGDPVPERDPLPLPKSVADIDFQQTPEVVFYIDDILAQGLTFLNAFSKVGKSRMIVQMLLMICNGAKFMGKDTKQSSVLYLALEDERIDFENRMKRFSNGAIPPKNFFYLTKEDFNYNTPTLDDDNGRGLLPFLEKQLEINPDIKVIAVDVFGVIRSKRKINEQFDTHERRDVDALIKFVAEHQIAMLVAHHVSKAGLRQMRTSSIGSGAGSYVISGTVHAEIEIALDQDDDERARFSVKGRRMKSSQYSIRDNFPFWTLEGEWDSVTFADDPTVATIKYLIQEFGQWRGSAKDLVQFNAENLDKLPLITRKPNKKTIEGFARQLQSIGIHYTQHPHGSAGVTHEFTRADADGMNVFTEIVDGKSWEDIKINSVS